MGNEASKVFERILDNSSDIVVEIRKEVYKLLGVNSQNQQLNEYVQECLEKFAFNVVENQFLEQIRNVVIDEINRSDLKLRNNESVDYDAFTSSLIEKLRQVKLGNISLDDDLKALADEITDRYPQINVSRDQFYSHFSSKKEQINNMINKHNQDIVEALIKFTPQLSSELSNQVKNNQNSTLTSATQEKNIVSSGLSVDKFLSRCTQKLDEVNLMFQNGGNSKSEIAKGFRQLKSFVANLNDKAFAQNVLDRYTKLNEVAQGVIYDNIIFENVPMLREIYEKYNSLLVQSQVDGLKNNLGIIFDSPVTVQEQRPINIGGTFPREPAISPVFGAEDNRAVNLRNSRELQERKESIPVYTEEEKQEIRNQMQQAQKQLTQTLEWAKQQPNAPQGIYTGDLTNLPDYVKDEIIRRMQSKSNVVISKIDSVYQEGNYIVVDAKDSNGHFIGSEFAVDDFANLVNQVQVNRSKQIRQEQLQAKDSEQVSVEQDKKVKDDLVQRIINAMNNAGEMMWGEISIDERMYRMNNIRNGLYNKSVEDLQILLATYQNQKRESDVSHKFQPIQEQTKQESQMLEQPLVEQEKQVKDNLVQQIMGAMNKSGEMSFGNISFSERMYRMNEIKNRLSNKSIEELQTLLSTYQEQSLGIEEQHSSSMRR